MVEIENLMLVWFPSHVCLNQTHNWLNQVKKLTNSRTKTVWYSWIPGVKARSLQLVITYQIEVVTKIARIIATEKWRRDTMKKYIPQIPRIRRRINKGIV